MDSVKPNKHVINPKELLKKEEVGLNRFNTKLALSITNSVGSMWTAYIFALLSLFSLPAILVLISPNFGHFFPHWIVSASLISLVAWISQNFLQLVLLPIIMVGQNVIQGQQDIKADTDHKTLTYLANLQEEQMVELKNQGQILEFLKKEIANKK